MPSRVKHNYKIEHKTKIITSIHVVIFHLFETDNNSITSDISTLIWADDTLQILDTNQTERICWTSSNCFEASDVTSDFFNDYGTRAEVQLRYLLQIFLEAGCLGWAVIIAIVLRDRSAVSRIIRAAYSAKQTIELTINLREGLIRLVNWSHTECLGYKQFLSTVQDQIISLEQLIEDKKKSQYNLLQEKDNSLDHKISVLGSQYISSHSRRSSTSCISSTAPCKDSSFNESSWITDNNSYTLKEYKEKDINISNLSCILS